MTCRSSQALKKQEEEQEVFTELPKWPMWVQTEGCQRFKVIRAKVKKLSGAIYHYR